MSNLSTFLGGGIALWVSGNTYAINDVVRSPSNWQVYARKVAGAGTTDPSSDATNWQLQGALIVKSIQRGVIAMGGAASATATITAVVTARTELRMLGASVLEMPAVGDIHAGLFAKIVLTNATTVTASFAAAANGGSVSWELTEYY